MASSSPGGLPLLSTGNAPPSSPAGRKASSPLSARPSQTDLRSPSRLHRKSSQQFNQSASPSQTRSHYTYDVPAPPNASQIATSHWKKELALHQDAKEPDTLVIVHDACYGHRYSRLKATKTLLSLIVERPERLQAGAVGMAGAYVRLGQRHHDGAWPILPKKEPSKALPFRIMRSSRSTSITSPVVANIHGAKWTQELKQMCDAAEARVAAHEKELTRPETPGDNANKPPLHEGDLYLCKDSLDAFQGAIGGVLDGVDAIFDASISGQGSTKAFVCVRPPGHHCSSDHPSGFCWLNNVHIGIEHAAQYHGLTHAAIIDFDLHHGDGSQSIAWERNAKAFKAAKNASQTKKTAIGYYSLHDINSYPCEDGALDKVGAASLCIDNAHGQSIWNVHLQPWKTEADFWKLYEERYLVLLEKTRGFLRHHTLRIKSEPKGIVPRAAIFISAGFDASEHESEGMQRHQVNVPTGFYARFTADIVRLSREEGLSVDGRVISVLEGGYSDRALTSGILSHVVGLSEGDKKHHSELNTEWWAIKALIELETALGKPPQAQGPGSRAIRPGDTGNYASPTQASTYKAVDPEKMYKSIGGIRRAPSPPPKPPTPPPPEIDWAQAAAELSKQLIPSDRTVASCRYDELNEPKLPKKERHSLPHPDNAPAPVRQTRGSKAKADRQAQEEKVEGEPNRRRTISTLPAPQEDEALGFFVPQVPKLEPDGRPSTASGSPTKGFTNAPSTSASRRSSISSRRSSPPPSRGATALKPAKSRQSSAAAPSRPVVSRQASHSRPSNPNDSSKVVSNPQNTLSGSKLAASNVKDNELIDMDQLTSKVKKITLHMPKDAAANDTKEASKPAKKPAPSRNTKPQPAKIASGKMQPPAKRNGPSSQATAPSSTDQPPPQDVPEPPPSSMSMNLDGAPFPAQNSASSTAPVPHDQAALLTAPPDASIPSNEANEAMDLDSVPSTRPDTVMTDGTSRSTMSSPFEVNPEFIAYKPSQTGGGAPSGVMPTPSNLTWVAPNSIETPRPASSKKNLPVFTATSKIPFAGGSNSGSTSAARKDEK